MANGGTDALCARAGVPRALPDGDADPGNADGDNDGTTTGGAAGSLLGLFSIGADQPGSIVLLSDTSSLEAQNLSSGGDSLAYVVVDGVVSLSYTFSPRRTD